MKRICLFAGYDSKHIIHDYVVYFLKELSTVSDVYYMADNEISEEEKSKIIPYVKGAYGFNHKKYDFGSWQELIKIIGWEKISEYDELILTNDSVFGPTYPMKDFFDIIEKDNDWDICGINKAVKNNILHLSSYFLVFKQKAFITNIFKTHIESILPENKLADVVEKYEVPFMKKFYENNYKVKSYCGLLKQIYFDWKEYCDAGAPFIKKKVFSNELFKYCHKEDWHQYIKNHTQYNVNYIDSYLQTLDDYEPEILKGNKIKKFFNWLIRINIKSYKFYFKLFGFYFIKINKIRYEYKIFGRDLKSKMDLIPIKEIKKN